MENTITEHCYSDREEVMHSLTHWFGTMFVCLGSGCLITLASLTGDPWKIVSVSIFSFSMILLYSASTAYHTVKNPVAKRRLKVMDHISIYILIAGTYTPFLLVNLRGCIGWTMFGVVWGMAIGGTVLKSFFTGRLKTLSICLYLLMGWMVMFTLKPLYNALPAIGLVFLLLGGLFYSGGVYFYMRKDKEFFHGIWHLFVLVATIMHFFSILYSCVLPVNLCR